MHIRKNILVSLVLAAALLCPLMAQGAAEKIPLIMAEQGVIGTGTTETAVTVEKTESPLTIDYAAIDMSLLSSRFSYAYSYRITSSLLSQGVSINGGYWLKGLTDGFDYFSSTSLINEEDMESVVNEYISDFYSVGETGDVGSYVTKDELSSLPSPETLLEKFSYCYAYIYAVQLKWMNGLDITLDEFLQGAAEALYLEEPVSMTDEEMDEAINEYVTVLNEEYEAYVEELSASNLLEAEEFLSENKDAEGMVVLPSGNLMEIVNEDEELGAVPGETDSVIVDYDLYLLDGTQLDSGSDITFPLTSLIPGFVEAVTNMKVGQECYVYIHPDYGYGESGTSSIEPNSLLIFRIYLKGIATE